MYDKQLTRSVEQACMQAMTPSVRFYQFRNGRATKAVNSTNSLQHAGQFRPNATTTLHFSNTDNS